jgi:hypothetical protein
MPGLFDRIRAELEDDDDDDSGGITPLDIVDLPDDQRKIMLWMLRDRETAAKGITPESLQTSMKDAPDNCVAILEKLAHNGWVVTIGEPPQLRYKVYLRRKRGSTSGFGLWTLLADRISRDDPPTN